MRAERGFFTVSSTATKCLVAYGLRPSAIRRRSRKGHPSQPRRPSGWLGAHAWTPPSRPPIQERGPRRRPPQNLEIERAADRNTPISIGLQLLQEPLMCVLKSTKSQKEALGWCTCCAGNGMAGCNTSACRRTLTAESTRTERQAGSRLRSLAIRPLKSCISALACTRPATPNAARSHGTPDDDAARL